MADNQNRGRGLGQTIRGTTKPSQEAFQNRPDDEEGTARAAPNNQSRLNRTSGTVREQRPLEQPPAQLQNITGELSNTFKDVATTLKCLWEGQTELNAKLQELGKQVGQIAVDNNRQLQTVKDDHRRVLEELGTNEGELIGKIEAELKEVKDELRAISKTTCLALKAARDQGTLEAGRAIDVEGLKEEVGSQAERVIKDLCEAIETQSREATAETIGAVNAGVGKLRKAVADVVAEEAGLGRGLMQGLTQSITQVKQEQERVRKQAADPIRNRSADPRPTRGAKRTQTRKDPNANCRQALGAKQNGTQVCDGKEYRSTKAKNTEGVENARPIVNPPRGVHPAKKNGIKLEESSITGSEEGSTVPEVWLSGDDSDPGEAGAPGAAREGNAPGAGNHGGKAAKPEDKTPNLQTQPRSGDGGSEEREAPEHRRGDDGSRNACIYECAVCKYTAPSGEDVRMHMIRVHTAAGREAQRNRTANVSPPPGAMSGSDTGEEGPEGGQGDDNDRIPLEAGAHRLEDSTEDGGESEETGQIAAPKAREEIAGDSYPELYPELDPENTPEGSSTFTRTLPLGMQRVLSMAEQESTPVRQREEARERFRQNLLRIPGINFDDQTSDVARTIAPMTPDPTARPTVRATPQLVTAAQVDDEEEWDPRSEASEAGDLGNGGSNKRKTAPTGRASAEKRKKAGGKKKAEGTAAPRPTDDDEADEDRRRLGTTQGAVPKKKRPGKGRKK